jgi:hypothetical protein
VEGTIQRYTFACHNNRHGDSCINGVDNRLNFQTIVTFPQLESASHLYRCKSESRQFSPRNDYSIDSCGRTSIIGDCKTRRQNLRLTMKYIFDRKEINQHSIPSSWLDLSRWFPGHHQIKLIVIYLSIWAYLGLRPGQGAVPGRDLEVVVDCLLAQAARVKFQPRNYFGYRARHAC